MFNIKCIFPLFKSIHWVTYKDVNWRKCIQIQKSLVKGSSKNIGFNNFFF